MTRLQTCWLLAKPSVCALKRTDAHIRRSQAAFWSFHPAPSVSISLFGQLALPLSSAPPLLSFSLSLCLRAALPVKSPPTHCLPPGTNIQGRVPSGSSAPPAPRSIAGFARLARVAGQSDHVVVDGAHVREEKLPHPLGRRPPRAHVSFVKRRRTVVEEPVFVFGCHHVRNAAKAVAGCAER